MVKNMGEIEENRVYRENLILKQTIKDLNDKMRILDRKVRETDEIIEYSKSEIIENAKKEFQLEIDTLHNQLISKNKRIDELVKELNDTKESEQKIRNDFYELDNKNYDEKRLEIEQAKSKKIEELSILYMRDKQDLIDKWDKIRLERDEFAKKLNDIKQYTLKLADFCTYKKQ
jgi:vacuolar-type H+-ATPase subunit I/STV1